MIRSLWTAASGMQAQTITIDVIANNLANANTAAYKTGRADFQDLLYETIRAPGASSSESTQIPSGMQIGHGTRPVAVQKLFSQGDYQHTENELDLAIEGEGFFQITQPNGEIAYTRAGTFKLDGEGRIVTSDGFLMEPEISVPEDTTAVTIGIDGTVSVMLAGETEGTELGTIQLVKFINPAGLKSIGRNLYQPTSASGEPVTGTAGQEGLGTISQGYLEMSNISVIDEMVSMITAQRAYEINSKAIQSADEMLKMANQLKR